MSFIVLKFGSSVLPKEASLVDAVQEIYRYVRSGQRVIAVVSALGDRTDQLVQRARAWGDNPPADVYATLLATGEAETAGLLGLALARAGIPAEVFDATRCALRTTPGCDAEPLSVDINVFQQTDAAVIVVPGFVGRDDQRRPTLLGRGGSDLTAAFLANALGARCRLLKDVDGLYDADPNEVAEAARLDTASWDEAIRIGGAVIQPKTVQFAKDHGLTLEVAALGSRVCTRIGAHALHRATRATARPLRIALLGCGTVGGAVLEGLLRHPDRFDVIGVAVRSDRDLGVPIYAPSRLVESDCDVVIELLGGMEPAAHLIERALSLGKTVVTANKAVLAANPALLSNPRLHCSASVGGAVPVLERIRLLDDIVHVEGVLNGTCNFVLDGCSDGRPLSAVVAEAQALGLAEADATTDLHGWDAAHKLAVISKLAFGRELVLDWISRTHVEGGLGPVRQIAWVDANGQAGVGLHDVTGALGRCRGADNAVILHRSGGEQVVLTGLGAGRWPTATAVLADLHALGNLQPTADREVA